MMVTKNIKMKICHFADAADIHTQLWVTYFANKKHEMHLISFRPLSQNLKNVHSHLLKKFDTRINFLNYLINSFLILRQVKRLLKEIKPNIIHGHSIIGHTIIAALTGFHPFVVSTWGSDVLIYPKESIMMRHAVPFVLKKADLIISDGENTKKAMIQMGAKREKIKILTYGRDTKKFNPSCRDNKLREELEIFNSPAVISTRRLGHLHNVETLVKAIPPILKEIPDTKFIIIGKGEQKEYLMDLAKHLNVFEVIRFLGEVPNDEMPSYLASSDVYVSTSLSDSGLAGSTAEAMACGLAVVITDSGDNKKWVKDGEGGFIVPVKNHEMLAEKIIFLLKNKDMRLKFGKINRKIIEEKYDYYKQMAKMENIYKELTEHKYKYDR